MDSLLGHFRIGGEPFADPLTTAETVHGKGHTLGLDVELDTRVALLFDPSAKWTMHTSVVIHHFGTFSVSRRDKLKLPAYPDCFLHQGA
jgi:hypothetical protein